MSEAPKKKRKRKEANPLPWVMLVIALICGAIWYVSRGSGNHKTAAVEKEMIITLPPPPPLRLHRRWILLHPKKNLPKRRRK